MPAVAKITKNVFAKQGAFNGNVKGITEVCIRLNNQAKALCSVDKGQLRNSIMYKVYAKGVEVATDGFNKSSKSPAPDDHKLSYAVSSLNEVVGIQGTNSDHWHIEFGTKNMGAKPFERPAKEIVVDGGKATAIAAKYQKEEMVNAYRRKKVVNG